jgi:hypothetical protein
MINIPNTDIKKVKFENTVLNPVFLMLLIVSCTSLDNLVKQGNFSEAENYCDNKIGKAKTASYRTLADACLKNGDLENAGKYFILINDREGVKKVADAYYYRDLKNVGKHNIYLDWTGNGRDIRIDPDRDIIKAEKYYDLINDKDGFKKVADIYFKEECYEFAGNNYLKASDNNGYKEARTKRAHEELQYCTFSDSTEVKIEAYEKILEKYPDCDLEESVKEQIALLRWNTIMEAKGKIEEYDSFKPFIEKYPQNKFAINMKMRINQLRQWKQSMEELQKWENNCRDDLKEDIDFIRKGDRPSITIYNKISDLGKMGLNSKPATLVLFEELESGFSLRYYAEDLNGHPGYGEYATTPPNTNAYWVSSSYYNSSDAASHALIEIGRKIGYPFVKIVISMIKFGPRETSLREKVIDILGSVSTTLAWDYQTGKRIGKIKIRYPDAVDCLIDVMSNEIEQDFLKDNAKSSFEEIVGKEFSEYINCIHWWGKNKHLYK